MPHIFAEITAQRLRLQLTQQELADLSGVSVRLIRELEAGRGNPGLNQLLRIASALGLAVKVSFEDHEDAGS